MTLRPLNEIASQVTAKITGEKNPSLIYVGLEHIGQSRFTLIGYAHGDFSKSTNGIFEPKDILFGKLRPNLRKSVQVQQAGYCSTDIIVLRATPEFNPEFVSKIFQQESVFILAEQTAIGTKMPRTSWKDLKGLLVFVPENSDEQHLIADILDTMDEAIQQTEQLITKLKLERVGLLHDLLCYGIDENGKLRDPIAHPEQFKESEMGLIPQGWKVHAIQDFSTVIRGASPRPKGDPRFYGGSIPRLMVEDVTRDGKWVTPQVDTLTEKGASLSRMMKQGDLVIVCSGTVGIPCLLAVDACIHDGFLGLPYINEAIALREYLYYRFVYTQQQFESNATHGGVFTNLTTTIVKNTLVPIPCLEEQHQINEILNMEETRIHSEQDFLEKLKTLKQGLMDDLLTGQVRVTTLLAEEK